MLDSFQGALSFVKSSNMLCSFAHETVVLQNKTQVAGRCWAPGDESAAEMEVGTSASCEKLFCPGITCSLGSEFMERFKSAKNVRPSSLSSYCTAPLRAR
jgi:hypothetical protein